ncbi:MAG: GIY-YIG nuclease family protein [Candidatus Lokiarchaeota archaeon]|nr:GIY-YIG nuclease family protein [Candidatus Lokiarchaeota archaeon]
MIECKGKDGRITLYTGYTNSIKRRFAEHASSRGARYTRGKSLRLVYFQTFRTRSDAMRREREIKALSRARKLSLASDPRINEYRGLLRRGHK